MQKNSDKSRRNLYQVYVENVTKNSDKSRRNLYQNYVENVTQYWFTDNLWRAWFKKFYFKQMTFIYLLFFDPYYV